MSAHPLLFEPGRIGTLRLPNRLLMAPMGTGYADENGRVTEQLIAYHVARARGGVALNITEHTAVARGGLAAPNMLGLHEDRHVPGFQDLCRAVHDAGGRIAVQLNHGGRQAHLESVGELVAPSRWEAPEGGVSARALSVDEIRELVGRFGAAAGRAQRAGADGVELHLAHGYLGASFLSPLTNRRTDEYGGDTDRRSRFARELLAEVRRVCGARFPVWCRLSADEFTEGGMSLTEAARIAVLLQQAGAQALHVSATLRETARHASAPYYAPPCNLVHLAEEIRRNVRIPVIAVGRVLTFAQAHGLLARAACDFVALGRALLADPDWPNKAREGRGDDLCPCIGCNNGCLQRRLDPVGVCFCVANPRTGREARWPAEPRRAGPPRRVLVIGGGPAGMTAATAFAAAGHEVELWEATEELGGAYALACLPPGKDDLRPLLDYQRRQLARTGASVRLGVTATAEAALRFEPEIAIVATGAEQAPAGLFPGASPETTVLADEVLRDPSRATGRVAVVGGGQRGAETAHFLAARGHPVTLIEAGPAIAPNLPGSVRAFLTEYLDLLGLTCFTGTEALYADSSGVAVVTGEYERHVEADTIVLALPRHSRAWLAGEIHAGGVPHVRLVGDARAPRTVHEAIYEGYAAAMQLGVDESALGNGS